MFCNSLEFPSNLEGQGKAKNKQVVKGVQMLASLNTQTYLIMVRFAE